MKNIFTLLEKFLSEMIVLRRAILLILDYVSIIFALLLTYLNNNINLFNFNNKFNSFYVISLLFIPLIFTVSFYLTSQYKGLTKYTGSTSFYKIAYKNFILVLFLSIVYPKFINALLPYQFWITFWLLSTFFTTSYRLVLRDLLILPRIFEKKDKNTRVIIYGAGQAGADLANSLIKTGNYTIICFFDDSPRLWGRTLHGIPIRKTKINFELRNIVDEVLIALPKINTAKRVLILKSINQFSIPVYQIPTIKDLTSGNSFINDLKPINIEDLLARDFVAPRKALLSKGIVNSSILVIGAGGSIGAELCRQILLLNPKKLILFDISESSLYTVNNSLEQINHQNIEISVIIGNACNISKLENILIKYKVNTIFHAAAYKHVPLVEINPLEGIYNNVFSTYKICKLVMESKYANKMIFISTDKAVRPTNVMGASKRLGELIIKSFSNEVLKSKFKSQLNKKIFSMVRFGNVLGSSGSVVPLFKKQIEIGGPITITHPKIVRYFMTIEEAAQLVLQSLGLAKGGEVFLLDMGDPVKIKDLAEQMVFLSGLTIKNKSNINGDIEIKYTGLRPGEKLYEELLISEDSERTSHPLIFKAIELPYEIETLTPQLDKLNKFIKQNQIEEALDQLNKIVPEWKRSRSNKI